MAKKYIAKVVVDGNTICQSGPVESETREQAIRSFADSLKEERPDLCMLAILRYPGFKFLVTEDVDTTTDSLSA
jgi:hypothetical protein